MTKNVGSADRIIRILVAIAVAALFFANMISSTLAFILGILAAVLAVTGLIGYCPLYKVLKISTLKKSNYIQTIASGKTGADGTSIAETA